jgi:hypothetical protein
MKNNANLVLQELVQEYKKRPYSYFVKLAESKSVEAFEKEKDGDSFQVEISAKFDNSAHTNIRCFIDVDTGKRLMKLLPITKEVLDSFVIDSSGVVSD